MANKVKITKKEYDSIEAQHASHGSGNTTGGVVVRDPKGNMTYKNARYVESTGPDKHHVKQTYSHSNHGIPTIEKVSYRHPKTEGESYGKFNGKEDHFKYTK